MDCSNSTSIHRESERTTTVRAEACLGVKLST